MSKKISGDELEWQEIVLFIVLALGFYQSCQSIAWIYNKAMDEIADDINSRHRIECCSDFSLAPGETRTFRVVMPTR